MKSLHLSIIIIVTSLVLPTAYGSGINTMPDPKFHATLDKNNYQNSEKPFLSIFTKPNATVNLLVLDSHGLQKLHKTVTLENGTITYSFDISSYSPGVCSVIVEEETDKIKLDFVVGLTATGGGIVLNTDRSSYLPGDNVTIVGAWNPNTLIKLSLIDPSGISIKSMQIFSDKTGHFSSFNFSIPRMATFGTWKIDGTSGVNHVSANVNVENIPGSQIDKTIVLSPLQQFRSGIVANDIKCEQGLQLIIKAEDNSPICVKSDTAMTLIKRGWAMSSLKNFGYNPGRGPVPEPNESGQFSSIGPSPFPPLTLNRLVFFIKSNSTAQIHVQYASELENTGNVDTGGQFYSGNPHDFIPLDSSQITVSSSPDHVSMNYGTNTTVVYTISTKNTTSGLYWIFLTQICGVMPVAIDMNSSQIAPSDIPVYSQHCPAQVLNAKILGISGGTAEYLQSQELQ